MTATRPCPACGHPTTRVRLPLSPRQREVLDWIAKYEADRHVFPSLSEIAAAFEFRSIATVHEHLQTLTRKGWIIRCGPAWSPRPFATTTAAWGHA